MPGHEKTIPLGQLRTRADVLASENGDAGWGLVVKNAGSSSLTLAHPLRVEVFDPADETVRERVSGYARVSVADGVLTAEGEINAAPGVAVRVRDSWTIEGSSLRLARALTVSGDSPKGFLSAVVFASGEGVSLSTVRPFVPGMIYGSSEFITPTAIGGRAHYEAGVRQVRIREDRLPIPMVGLYFPDGSSATVFDAAPDARTNVSDGEEKIAANQINERCRVAALGYCEGENDVTLGMWFPGTEGEVTYQWALAPENQVRRWRGRYHPLRDGFTQRYEVELRFARGQSFERFYAEAWRHGWERLRPEARRQDIDLARRTLVEMVADRVVGGGGLSGIPTIWEATTGEEISAEDSILVANKREAVMGFLGRNTDLAYFLLYEAAHGPGGRGERYARLGTSILDSFARIRMCPPSAEGFSLKDGSPVALTYRGSPLIHLRALSEGVNSMLKAWELERRGGRERPHWLKWCVDFADWLVGQQSPEGGFPRAWGMATGEVGLDSPKSSYTAIPFLARLSRVTGGRAYLDAALRAAEFCWSEDQSLGQFVGGTLDNPNVIDKEAGTLSLEAYLALYEATGGGQWLERATTAADFAETWMYCWNVPMPEDADPDKLHWAEGVSSVGFQLISTGHSAVDAYMAFDVASYAKLYAHTKDPHYFELAKILLHNTKQMLALPGRTFDLAGPGWQQEGWNLTPPRGYGWHRHWLPWVAASHLTGIVELRQFDPELYERLAGPDGP